jgi:NTP pyrophosphatase (non-canonical NTP hydrolase)
MHEKGLTKLIEECGELIQIAAKQSAYLGDDSHPDGSHMPTRMQEEMGDVLAAIDYVVGSFQLSLKEIDRRRNMKFKTYEKWDKLIDCPSVAD